ncbi:hypothetical protein EVAR_102604_1 [Eumeta japonica]|uniref:Uncharacterized protein n=1 Tax=Eumeta variegata TaxID=151549 RepID=A0A4C1TVJ9_EUMVA|nr:hypothetical protein EVAR_102604_1 [Eumeta japonica]
MRSAVSKKNVYSTDFVYASMLYLHRVENWFPEPIAVEFGVPRRATRNISYLMGSRYSSDSVPRTRKKSFHSPTTPRRNHGDPTKGKRTKFRISKRPRARTQKKKVKPSRNGSKVRYNSSFHLVRYPMITAHPLGTATGESKLPDSSQSSGELADEVLSQIKSLARRIESEGSIEPSV